MAEIGSVVSSAGKVVAVLDGAERVLSAGSGVFEGEAIRTGDGASVEIRFDDETVLSQGPNSELTLDSYVYNPNAPAQSSFLFKMAQGTYRMATGQIAEDNPDGVRLESPLATIGIRGTTTVSRILPDGTELHAAESLSGGRSIILQDQFGNQQLLTFTSGGVPFNPNIPMGAVITVPRSVFDAIRASAPLTSRGEPPAGGAGNGDAGGDKQGVSGEGGAGPEPDVPGPDGAGPDGPGPDGAGPDGQGADGQGPADTAALSLIGGDALAALLGLPDGTLDFLTQGALGRGDITEATDPAELLERLIAALISSSHGLPGEGTDTQNTLETETNTTPAEQTVTPPVSGVNIITGTSGPDLLKGTSGSDSISGLGGDDTLVGNRGADTLVGGKGDDTIYGSEQGQEDRLKVMATVTHDGDSLEDGAFARIDTDSDYDVVLLAQDSGGNSTLAWYETSLNPLTHAISLTEHVIDTISNDYPTSALAVGDSDNDGDNDIFLGMEGGQILRYENLGNGTFAQDTVNTLDSLSGSVDKMLVTDLDGDGQVDDLVVRGSGNGGELVWYTNGAGTPQTIQGALGGSDILAVAEVNSADGNYREVFTQYGSHLKCFHYDGSNWGYSVVEANVTGSQQRMALGDVDGDGDLDLFFSDDDTLRLYMNNGGSYSESSVSLQTPGVAIAALAVGDFIGNSDLDLLVATANDLYIYHNVNDGQWFEKTALLSTDNTIDDVMVGDFDGDGKADDVVIHYTGGTDSAVIYENLLSEAEQNTVSYKLSATPVTVDLREGVATSDVGGDGTDSLHLVDNIIGSAASDSLDNGDTLYGNGFDNKISGLAGNDSIEGGGGDDSLSGDDGSDYIIGGMGNDLISGGSGDDVLFGDEDQNGVAYGHDSISGGSGNDEIHGGYWNDLLLGNSGTDQLFGDDGNDTLWGGTGGDSLTGGNGDDVFYYSSQLDAGDVVNDFNNSDDTFSFLSSQFGSLAHNAALSAGNFVYWVKADHYGQSFTEAGGTFAGGTAGFVYEVTDSNAAYGNLYFDNDTGHTGDEVLIATVTQTTAGSAGAMAASDIYLTDTPFTDPNAIV